MTEAQLGLASWWWLGVGLVWVTSWLVDGVIDKWQASWYHGANASNLFSEQYQLRTHYLMKVFIYFFRYELDSGMCITHFTNWGKAHFTVQSIGLCISLSGPLQRCFGSRIGNDKNYIYSQCLHSNTDFFHFAP